jgi:hypothetical protein
LYETAAPLPPSVKLARMIAGKPIVLERRAGLGERVAVHAARDLEADLQHRRLELVAVLRLLDRRQAGADQLDPVAREDALAAGLERQVERRLAADRRQDRVGLLGREHAVEELRGQRLDVRGRPGPGRS